MTDYTLPQWHYLLGEPSSEAWIRREPEHFQVDEMLPFTPDGAGEHHLLHIEKRDLTTHQLAKIVAKFADVPARDVSWAGLKDRHGVTRQWLSVRIPGKVDPDWAQLNDRYITLLAAHRHGRKLRTGALLGNRFKIALSGVTDRDALEARLAEVSKGVPNYYGEQRFGHGGNNVRRAAEMFSGRKVKDRNKRSIYLSAARSFLFNHVVSARLAQHGVTPLAGDAVMLHGSNSFFVAEQWDAENLGRLLQGDIELSAPLPGDGDLRSQGVANAFETEVLAPFAELTEGLKSARVDVDRRRLLLKPEQFRHHWEDDLLWLEFVLPSGAFATSVLRELARYQDAQAIELRSEIE
ncbi:tRNA pseudouridine(13) synthase TruD [Ferrimonas balearica]|uniref:tRNA pseudouridine(13) synthase TruD n=1 Tax=Ferrimonas balearica TaxID=44012 RepID=UPI001C56B68D|nr:tRNA pseudouridine(13) synthase TruD [Ferrimonas balearica]MBW3164481.1 tRNA pseudouridine(13) synthase TruD [Ferrimonas balearica]MBY6224879.1 tRNA pseudouridine(13) synthase TruD [Ferrimonas balearica]